MASIYDNTANIFRSDFRQMSITDSGTFSLTSEETKKVTVFNDAGYKIRVYKTDNQTGNAFLATSSGTSQAEGIYLNIEDGISFTIPGVSNANHISVQKDNKDNPTLEIKYILER